MFMMEVMMVLVTICSPISTYIYNLVVAIEWFESTVMLRRDVLILLRTIKHQKVVLIGNGTNVVMGNARSIEIE